MMIKRKEALEIYEETMGRKITFSGLYSLGDRGRFLVRKNIPGRKYPKILFSKEKMIKFLNERKNK